MTADFFSFLIVAAICLAAVLVASEIRGIVSDLHPCQCSCCQWCCQTCTCAVIPDDDDGENPPVEACPPPDVERNGHPCGDRRFKPEVVNYVAE